MDNLLERGVEEIIEKDHLKARLEKGDKLRVKLGIDPTAKDLHLGHTVVLRKLRQFQDAGHQAVLIIGDFTALIGDPSGRNDSRPPLTKEQVEENLKNYLTEAGKVVSLDKLEVHRNSEWFTSGGAELLMELTSKFTVARMLERDDFQKRIKEDRDVGVLEILYPILQGYDSCMIKADVELGGTDQKFNLLMGRKVQKRYAEAEQDVMMMPLVEGLDGIKKMSKSLGNYIGLSDSPNDMFGKIMSIPDDLMIKYFLLLTDISEEEIEQLRNDRLQPSIAKTSPKEWKQRLASEIVSMYHGVAPSVAAAEEFSNVFSKKEKPTEMDEFSGDGDSLVDFMFKNGLAKSKTEAKQLFEQGAVQINDQTEKESWDKKLKAGDIIQVGPRKFAKVK